MALHAQDIFNKVALLRAEVARLEDEVSQARQSVGPHGPSAVHTRGGGARDAMAPIDALIDSDAERQLERARASFETWAEVATRILYGRSGRGGIARAMGTTTADMLTLYYCQGESWHAIGKRVEATGNLSTWCERRAEEAFEVMDRVGLRYFIES